jgi:hypothetical protein
MSDDYIHIIPAELGVVPDDEKRQCAVSYFRNIAPKASEVSTSELERMEFIHCGANLENICCPSCGAVIELDLWHEWMDHDWSDAGFSLTQHAMPCCSAQHTLHELAYAWPQGFARCDVCATNPGIGKLSDEQRSQFEKILGCPVRVIYEHL